MYIWYTIFTLAAKMLAGHRLTIARILRKSRWQIPPNFLIMKGKEKKTNVFEFKENFSLVSYILEERKNYC